MSMLGRAGEAAFGRCDSTARQLAHDTDRPGLALGAPLPSPSHGGPPMSSADKLLAALSLFTPTEPEWTIEDAAEALDVSGSTAYRYFSSLTQVGLLDPISGGRYVLGPAIMAIDRQLRLQDSLIQIARPVLSRLVSRNGGVGVALLCRRFRQQVMCIHQEFEHRPDYAVSYERGRPMGLYRGSASVVILANMPPRTLQKLWAEDSAAIIASGLGDTWEQLRENLRSIRRAGVYVSWGQIDKGLIGISAPIFQADRQRLASIGLVIQESATSASDVAGLSALVKAAVEEIHAGLSALDLDERPEG
jgi:DNA-binding IclR family transcriptional regulator